MFSQITVNLTYLFFQIHLFIVQCVVEGKKLLCFFVRCWYCEKSRIQKKQDKNVADRNWLYIYLFSLQPTFLLQQIFKDAETKIKTQGKLFQNTDENEQWNSFQII